MPLFCLRNRYICKYASKENFALKGLELLFVFLFCLERYTCKMSTVMAFARNIGKKKKFFNLHGGWWGINIFVPRLITNN
jgi:uncharacterized membrane protein